MNLLSSRNESDRQEERDFCLINYFPLGVIEKARGFEMNEFDIDSIERETLREVIEKVDRFESFEGVS